LELKEVDEMEVPWEDKYDKIFWRGATTGGGGHPPGYATQYHRHRYLFLFDPFALLIMNSSDFYEWQAT
jgi:hypothetical protein